jgi:hypothetical protein
MPSGEPFPSWSFHSAMTRTAVLSLCLMLGFAAASEAGAEPRGRSGMIGSEVREVPLPPRRPEAVPDQEAPPAAPQPETTAAIPVPPPRPSEPIAPAAPASVVETPQVDLEFQGCLDRLAILGVQVEPMPPIRDGACGAQKPVRLTRLPDGVAISTPAVVTCPVAEALARWTKEVLAVESDRAFQTAPLSLQIGTSYQCRGQNRQALAKLSEHAFANAVDVMGFTFPKRAPIPVTFHPEGSPEDAFFKAVRAGACTHFTTVLGPGSDAYHANHLHLDLRGRRGTARLCQ